MKMAVWGVGRVKKNELADSLQQYMKRMRPYHPVSMEDILVKIRSTDPEVLRNAEGEKILSRLTTQDVLILMDEGGKQMTSPQFAAFLQKIMMEPASRIIFLIGGPYGFDSRVYARANHRISLSPMTFPHDLARLITVEQLYRAFSILNHSPYHH